MSTKTLPANFPHLDLKLLNFSRIAMAVAVILMVLALGVSYTSYQHERNQRMAVISEVASLKAELESVKRHCAMDIAALKAEISTLKRLH
jgi:translation elongation factor EF-Ts